MPNRPGELEVGAGYPIHFHGGGGLPIEGSYPTDPGGAKAQFVQGLEEKVPFDSIEYFFKVQKKENQVLVAFFYPT